MRGVKCDVWAIWCEGCEGEGEGEGTYLARW